MVFLEAFSCKSISADSVKEEKSEKVQLLPQRKEKASKLKFLLTDTQSCGKLWPSSNLDSFPLLVRENEMKT